MFKNYARIALCFGALAWLGVLAESASAAAYPKTGKTYRIINKETGTSLTAAFGKKDNGTPAIMWQSENFPNHLWYFAKVGTDFRIINRETGKSLTAAGGKKANGTPAILWTSENFPNHLWTITHEW